MGKIVKKKSITLDELAIMVQRGFEGVDKQFNELRTEMNHRFNEIETRLDHLEKIVHDEYHSWIIRLEDRIKSLESDFRSILSGRK